MIFEVLKYDVVGNCSVGCREIAHSPESLPPVALADVRELPLQPVRRTAFHPAHQIGNGNLRRNRHKHMHMIGIVAKLFHFGPVGKSVQIPGRWLRIVDEILCEGESISGVARRNGIAPNLLYRWRKLMLD